MLNKFNFIEDEDVKNKTILLRVDINSPVKHGRVIRSPKILEHAKTVRLLCEKGAKVVVLSHQGRKGGKDFISLESHEKYFEKLSFDSIKKVSFCDWDNDFVEKIKQLNEGEVLLLDNTRFLEFETEKKSAEEHSKNEIIKKLATVSDMFVLDALSVAHRSHATVVGFVPLLPSFAGPNLKEELVALDKVDKIEKNICLVLGGLKPKEPLRIMENLLSKGKAKSALLGGIMGELAIMASGKSLGLKDDFIEEKGLDKFIPDLKKLMDTYPHKIKYPKDVAVEKRGKRRELSVSELPVDFPIYDVGHHTISEYADFIEKSDLVIYNGPFGVFENTQFRAGTKDVFDAIHDHSAFSFVGGGDTVTALVGLGFRKDDFSHVSLAGGALLEYLSGNTLPGLEVLKKKA